MPRSILDTFSQFKGQVKEIGSAVTSDDVDTYRQIREIEDKSYKLKIVLDAWKAQKKEERKWRNIYAGVLLGFLFIQIVVVNVSFFLIGAGKLKVEEWVANTFIIAVFGEVASMTLVIVRYLFPKTGEEFPKIIEGL